MTSKAILEMFLTFLGEASADGSKSDYVRREEFDQLVAAFEAFKRETSMQIKELEKRLAANGDQPQKL